ncbi:hypothetical protein [Oceaniradius stylonematis]|uniref:hypothetical protein n=1 Tax=Oceaniradius stylonematis TaxID=2184161 RepID=UPI00273DE8B5|nr:hypothetical protein [Oceaniradius stylonematis]
MTEKMFSILLAWEDGDHDAGEYAWAGMADSHEDAIAKARRRSYEDRIESLMVDGETEDDYPFDDYAASEIVLDSMEGVNMWQAKDLLNALKAMRGELDAMSGYWTEGMANFAQQADDVIAKAELGANAADKEG